MDCEQTAFHREGGMPAEATSLSDMPGPAVKDQQAWPSNQLAQQ